MHPSFHPSFHPSLIAFPGGRVCTGGIQRAAAAGSSGAQCVFWQRPDALLSLVTSPPLTTGRRLFTGSIRRAAAGGSNAYDALLLVARAVHNVLSGDTTDGADSQNSLVEPVPPSQGPGAYNEDGAGSGSFPGVESGGVARAAGAAGAEGNSSSSDGSSRAAAAGSVFVSNSSAAGQEPGTWAHVPMPVVAPGDSASSLIPILSGAARSNCEWVQCGAPSGWLARQQDPLRIAVPNKKGYNQFVEILPPTAAQGNDRFTGFCLDLFRAAVARLPYELSYEFLQFGEGDATPSYTEMVYAVANHTYDGAIGDIAVLNFRSEAVDFTVPIQQSGLSLVSYVAPNDNPWISYHPFSWQMWLLLACLIVFSGLVLCFLESSHPAHLLRREYDRPHQEVMSYICSYIAALTAALVLQKLQLPISHRRKYHFENSLRWRIYLSVRLICLRVSPAARGPSGTALPQHQFSTSCPPPSCPALSCVPLSLPLNGEQEYYKALTSFFPPFSPSNLPRPQSCLMPLNSEQDYYKALTSFFPPFSPSHVPLPQSRLVPLNGEQEYYKALTSFFPPFSPSNLPRPQSCLMPLNSEQDYYKALTSFFPPFSPSHVPLPQSRLVPLTSEQDYYEALSSQRVAIVVGEDPLPQRLPLSRAPPTLPPTLIPHPQSRLVPLNSEQDYYEALTSQRVALIVDEDPYLNVFASQYCQMLRASQAFNVLNSAFAFQKGSLFGADISQALLELAQNGELQRIRSMYIKSTASSVDCIFSRLHLQSTASSVDCIFSRLHFQSTAFSVDCIFSRLHLQSTASSVDCIFSRLHLQSTASSVDCIFSRLRVLELPGASAS
ncbi:unnamed protein product [Closterium sp. NIES-54]